MRVLQLGKFYPIRGGVEKVMRDLTEGLCAAGVPCDMLCAMHPGAGVDEKDAGRVSREGKMTVIRVDGGGRILCVCALAVAAGTMIAPAMLRYLARHQAEYDIIHVHHPDPMAALALRLSGYKGRVILHWHSDIFSQKQLLRLYLPLQQWLVRRAERIVGTTPVYLEGSPYLAGVQERCVCVPIGIDPVRCDPAEAARRRASFPQGHLLLSVGRLVPYKGYRYLVEALRMLPEDYHLVIVGKGPLQAELEQQIAADGLQGRVTLAGFVSDRDLPSYFAACDVFVLSSVLKTEAFAIVQPEAMSCGKPVVSTRIPDSGVAWVNRDGCSGLTVPPAEAGALAQAIRRICEDRELYEKLSLGARERFESLFTLNQMINKIKQIYEQKM